MEFEAFLQFTHLSNSFSFSFPFPTPNQPCRDFKDKFNQDEKTQIKISHITCQPIGTVLCSFGLHTKALTASQ